jgi:hypothetical protein
MTDPHAGLQTPADSSRGSNAASATQLAEPISSGAQAIPADNQHLTVQRSKPYMGNGLDLVDEMEEHLAGIERLRVRKLIELLFASQDLVRSLVYQRPGTPNIKGSTRCGHCHAGVEEGTVLEHYAGCKVGRVASLIGALQGLELNSKGKETAQTAEGDRADDGKHPRGLFGEPWEYCIDEILQRVTLYDYEGALIVSWPKCDREAIEQASRIVDCINSSSGMEYHELRKATGGDYFLVRVEDREEFYGFAEAWKANPSWRPCIAHGTKPSLQDYAPDLLDACQAQHKAIDSLFAMIVTRDRSFLPSRSGEPWKAMVHCTKVIAEALRARRSQEAGAPRFVSAAALARTCGRCNRGDGSWRAEDSRETSISLSTLLLNQCVGARQDGLEGCTVYTHQCLTAPIDWSAQ